MISLCRVYDLSFGILPEKRGVEEVDDNRRMEGRFCYMGVVDYLLFINYCS